MSLPKIGMKIFFLKKIKNSIKRKIKSLLFFKNWFNLVKI